MLEGFKAWLDKDAGGEPAWSLDPVNHEGWRVSVDEGDGARGWALLRASLHDPLLVLNVESDVPGGARVTQRANTGCLGRCVLGRLANPHHSVAIIPLQSIT